MLATKAVGRGCALVRLKRKTEGERTSAERAERARARNGERKAHREREREREGGGGQTTRSDSRWCERERANRSSGDALYVGG